MVGVGVVCSHVAVVLVEVLIGIGARGMWKSHWKKKNAISRIEPSAPVDKKLSNKNIPITPNEHTTFWSMVLYK